MSIASVQTDPEGTTRDLKGTARRGVPLGDILEDRGSGHWNDRGCEARSRLSKKRD